MATKAPTRKRRAEDASVDDCTPEEANQVIAEWGATHGESEERIAELQREWHVEAAKRRAAATHDADECLTPEEAAIPLEDADLGIALWCKTNGVEERTSELQRQWRKEARERRRRTRAAATGEVPQLNAAPQRRVKSRRAHHKRQRVPPAIRQREEGVVSGEAQASADAPLGVVEEEVVGLSLAAAVRAHLAALQIQLTALHALMDRPRR
jgi:hypothetical protein